MKWVLLKLFDGAPSNVRMYLYPSLMCTHQLEEKSVFVCVAGYLFVCCLTIRTQRDRQAHLARREKERRDRKTKQTSNFSASQYQLWKQKSGRRLTRSRLSTWTDINHCMVIYLGCLMSLEIDNQRDLNAWYTVDSYDFILY